MNLRKIDEITFLGNSKGKVILLFEWENIFCLYIHLQEIKLALDKSKKQIE